MSIGIFDCLKCERVINIKSMLSDEKTVFRCTPALSKFFETVTTISAYLTRFCPRYILQQHVPARCPLVWAHLK